MRKTWSQRGRTPVVRHRFSRKRLNAIVAVAYKPDGSNCDTLFFMQPQEINSWSTIAYLEVLHEEIPGPVMLLWDGLPSHRSKIVKDHISEQKEWLRVEQFPSYAPELNPAEYMISALKTKDVANFCADNLELIADKLEEAATRIGTKTDLVQGFLKASSLFSRLEFVVPS